MCGRFALDLPEKMLINYFDVPIIPHDFGPHYNIAPTQPVLTIRCDEDNKREAVYLRWGFIPPWMKAEDVSSKFINARAETAHEKPMFRHAFSKKRCLIVASGFYEWRTTPEGKQPFYIHSQDDTPIAFAGLWSYWHQAGHDPIESCTILTTDANKALQAIHTRMPVMLSPPAFAAWLDRGIMDVKRIAGLLAQQKGDALTYYPVSSIVNNPRNDTPECVKQVGR